MPVVKSLILKNGQVISGTTGNPDASDLPIFGASGPSHAPGAAPDPGATAGTTRYLREDATWDAPGGSPNPGLCQFRLSAAPASSGVNPSGGSSITLYWNPYSGDQVSLYNGTTWVTYTQSAGASINVNTGFTANLPYDVFAFYNGTAVVLVTEAWGSTTARQYPNAPAVQDGVYVSTQNNQYRYLGTIYPISVAGSVSVVDSDTQRFIWNYYNRINKRIQVLDPNTTWTYSISSAYILADNGASPQTNQISIINGIAEGMSYLSYFTACSSTASGDVHYGIGVNSVTSVTASSFFLVPNTGSIYNSVMTTPIIPAIGLTVYSLLILGIGTGTQTWYAFGADTGIAGIWPC